MIEEKIKEEEILHRGEVAPKKKKISKKAPQHKHFFLLEIAFSLPFSGIGGGGGILRWILEIACWLSTRLEDNNLLVLKHRHTESLARSNEKSIN